MNQVLPKKTSLQIFLIDCHEICIGGTIEVLHSQYPNATILTAQTADNALHQLTISQPDLVIIDICVPEKPGVRASTNAGIQLLRNLMENYPNLNIVVHSAHIKSVVRIIPEIDAHTGGFTVADKTLSTKEMLARVDWALQGLTHTKEIKEIYAELELKPEWHNLLTLAFQEGLQDKAIAQRISVSERMVRHYWDKLQNALGIDGEELKNQGKNLRIITQIRAREAGLID
jgi:DNA-binding NarL/FixJ family response regulator